ncbi:hypothetical protein PENPOL_c019G08256 [Penicillium polonicum]|uniref:Uncharacterized protein n=1 Tax=Penicillium polonicum TaxID=60169 RepID=A0A1V6N8M6_PENPO|nr:hypothetical protein PENPOL_c019G08256 [Penicillium polonicum]
MGVRPSKVAMVKPSTACSDAAGAGKEKVDVDLGDSEFLETLKELWSNLPERTQRYITGERRGKQASNKRRKLPKQTHSKITIDASLLDKVPQWNTNPLLFFSEDKAELTLLRDPLSELNTYMAHLRDSKGLSVVRFRLIQVIYHRLKEERLCVKQLRAKDVQRLTRITSHSGLSGNSRVPEPSVAEWVEQGKRIDELCRALGSVRKVGYSHLANLFFLQDVSDTTIKKIPMQPEEREKADVFQVLKARTRLGIDGRNCLEELAINVIQTLWGKVENSITDSDFGMGVLNNDICRSGQSYNMGVDTFYMGFHAPDEPWSGPLAAQSDAQTALDSSNNGQKSPPLARSDGSSTSVVWDGQYYNMGTDAFNVGFGAPNEPWNEPRPVQSNVASGSLGASDNGNTVPPVFFSDGSSNCADWGGQFYNLGMDVFDDPNESWDASPPIQSNVPPGPLVVAGVSEGQDMGLVGSRAEGTFDAVRQARSPANWILSAG